KRSDGAAAPRPGPGGYRGPCDITRSRDHTKTNGEIRRDRRRGSQGPGEWFVPISRATTRRRDSSRRKRRRGAGITLKRTARSGVIADAVRKVLENGSYRLAAQRLGDAIRRDASGDALIRELEDISGEASSNPLPFQTPPEEIDHGCFGDRKKR